MSETGMPAPEQGVPLSRPMRRGASILWAGFLVAAALELAVFAFVDPQSLNGLTGTPLGISNTAVYSVAFAVFWIVASAGAALSLLLDGAAEDAPVGAGAGAGAGAGPSPVADIRRHRG